MTRYLDAIPQPWTRDAIQKALFDNFTEARSAIEDTDGGRLWRRLEELDETVWIFHFSVTDLLDEICLFGDRSKYQMFWHTANADEAESHTRAVKRKLFNCTSALMTLVDHARNFQRQTPVAKYDERLKEEFSVPGLHEFLQCFRNYNTHWRIAQTNWQITHDFQEKKREARFQVTKEELLAWSGWTSKAREFIDQSKDTMDVYELFAGYREYVEKFYAWHKGAVLDEYSGVVGTYLEHKRLYEGLSKKFEWNLVLTRARKDINPYQYIGRYLPKQKLKRLLAYQHRSEEQVEALIRMLDMEDFCDEDLRRKLFALFRPSDKA